MSPASRPALAAFFALLVCAALIVIARRAADAPATSDAAVIESYTLMATRGTLQVGAYSRFQWHHPGPLDFYLLAPFYAAADNRTAGLHAGAAALSIASIALMTAVLLRRRPSLALLTGFALALYAWRAAEAVSSPWNPHAPVLVMAALIVVAADVLAGRPQALPLVALLASAAGQAHIAVVPAALTIGVLAIVGAAARAAGRRDREKWLYAIGGTVLVLAVCWALPVYEQFTARPRGNLTELWDFFVHHAHGRQPLAVAVSAWSDMLVGVVRPDFYVAHGWPFVESPVHWAEWLTLVSVAATLFYALAGVRRRDVFSAALGGLIVVSASIALWSATRIDQRVFDHDVFWIAGIGLLAMSTAVDGLLSPLVKMVDRRGWSAAGLTTGVLVASGAIAAAVQVNDVARRSFDPPPDARLARALADDLEAFMTREQIRRPLIRIDQDAWGYVAGAILDLQKRGRDAAVEEDWVVMFTPAFRANGNEDAVITVAMPPEHLRLMERGARVISAHEPIYAHVEPAAR